MKTTVFYRIKSRTRDDLYGQNSNCLSSIGDSLCWLNNEFNKAYQDSYNEDLVFEWEVVSRENSYSGKLLLENGSFLEKILRIDLSEFQK